MRRKYIELLWWVCWYHTQCRAGMVKPSLAAGLRLRAVGCIQLHCTRAQSSPLLTPRTSFHLLSAQASLQPEPGEEQWRRAVETKYTGFIHLRVFSASHNTNWLWKIGSENEYPGHCSLLLCCEITFLNENIEFLWKQVHNISGNENPVELTKERRPRDMKALYL